MFRRLVAAIDFWDLHIYGGLVLVFGGCVTVSFALAAGVTGAVLVVLGVFGPRIGGTS